MWQMVSVAATSLTTGGTSLDDIYTLLTLFGGVLMFDLFYGALYLITCKIDEYLTKED